METTKWIVYILWKMLLKWMRQGGSPIVGNLKKKGEHEDLPASPASPAQFGIDPLAPFMDDLPLKNR